MGKSETCDGTTSGGTAASRRLGYELLEGTTGPVTAGPNGLTKAKWRAKLKIGAVMQVQFAVIPIAFLLSM